MSEDRKNLVECAEEPQAQSTGIEDIVNRENLAPYIWGRYVPYLSSWNNSFGTSKASPVQNRSSPGDLSIQVGIINGNKFKLISFVHIFMRSSPVFNPLNSSGIQA